MTITIDEVVGISLTAGKSPSRSKPYRVCGTDNELTVRTLVDAASPAVYFGLLKEEINVDEVANGVWDADVSYGTIGRKEEGSVDWSFEIGTQNVKITQALEHIASYAPPAKIAPDHKGAIGVRRDGTGITRDGTEIEVPTFTWEETHRVLPSAITEDYIETLEELVATTNDSDFRIWGASEILLMGVTGGKRAEKTVDLTFRFGVSRTKKQYKIGDIDIDEKKGWHYLWVEYEPVEDPNSKDLTTKAKAVHVERVYEEGDWSKLSLLNPWG